MRYGITCPDCGEIFDKQAKRCPNCGFEANILNSMNIFSFLRQMSQARLFSILFAVNLLFFLLSLFVSLLSGGIQTSWGILPAPNMRSLEYLGWADPYSWQSSPVTLLMASFLHAGVIHFGFNMFALRDLLRLSPSFFSISVSLIAYLLAGIAGNFAAVTMGEYPVVGASGSVLGLMGAIMAVGFSGRNLAQKFIVMQLAKWAVLIFIFGLLIPNVSNEGHIGGFICGYIVGLLYSKTGNSYKRRFEQIAMGLLIVCGIALIRGIQRFLLLF